MSKKFSLLGVKISLCTMQDAVENICKNVKEKKQTFIVTANSEIVMLCKNDAHFKHIVNCANFVYPDGIGIVWGGRYLGHEITERITGFDLVQELFKKSCTQNINFFLFGTEQKTVEKAVANTISTYPNANIVGFRNGFFSSSQTDEIIQQINEASPDILLVALGAPKQEKWLFENKDKLNATVLLGVGGSFDVIAGNVKRAPKLMQDLGLEWLYRLSKQPQRFLRMLAIPKFMFYVWRSKNN